MIVQFFRYGDGLSKGPLDYLLGKDRNREHARTLSGNEQEIIGLIDSSPYAKKYTSGCLSFYEEDLTDEIKQKVMLDFEKCLFPNMTEDQYRILWIEHRDKINEETGKQRLELNFLIPNVEITTGQRLQPYYHVADLARVDLFKKITNYEQQLHDPDDPLVKQIATVNKNLPKATADLRATIDQEAKLAIAQGIITDRASMKTWLETLDLEITRETPKSLSIKNPNGIRPIRLTGTIYEDTFRLTEESARYTQDASRQYRQRARSRYKADIQRYREYTQQKGAELKRKYRPNEINDTAPTSRIGTTNPRADTRTNPNDYSEIPGINPNYFEPSKSGIDRTTEETRNTNTGTTNQPSQTKQLDERNWQTDQLQKHTFQIDPWADFNRLYTDYDQYLFRLQDQGCDQDQRRTRSEKSGITSQEQPLQNSEMWLGRKLGMVRENQSQNSTHKQLCNTGRSEQLTNDFRQSTLEHYRTATETTTNGLSQARSTDEYNYRIRELQQKVTRIQWQLDQEKQRVGKPNQYTTEPEAFREFTQHLADQLQPTLRESLRKTSNRIRDQKPNYGFTTESSTARDQSANETVNLQNSERNRTNQTILQPFKQLDTDTLFKALNQLEKRKKAEFPSFNFM